MILKEQKYKHVKLQTPDWREVVAYSARLSEHKGVKVNIIEAIKYAVKLGNEELDKQS